MIKSNYLAFHLASHTNWLFNCIESGTGQNGSVRFGFMALVILIGVGIKFFWGISLALVVAICERG